MASLPKKYHRTNQNKSLWFTDFKYLSHWCIWHSSDKNKTPSILMTSRHLDWLGRRMTQARWSGCQVLELNIIFLLDLKRHYLFVCPQLKLHTFAHKHECVVQITYLQAYCWMNASSWKPFSSHFLNGSPDRMSLSERGERSARSNNVYSTVACVRLNSAECLLREDKVHQTIASISINLSNWMNEVKSHWSETCCVVTTPHEKKKLLV